MIDIVNGDGRYPTCAHDGCKDLAVDGYCEATCCIGYNPRRAYCSLHSHRPTRLLEILGHSPNQMTFTRDEVRTIVMTCWAGAGLVFEHAGKFEMEADIVRDRQREAIAAALKAEAPKSDR